MEKKDNNRKKRPLKLSSAGRLQLRRNLGPSKPGGPPRQDKGKTIQVVFKNRNNKQQKSSTTKSNLRGYSSFRTQSTPKLNTPFQTPFKNNRNFIKKPNKLQEEKKHLTKKQSPKLNVDQDEKSGKLSVHKVLEKEAQEYDKFPSLAKIKRAREKERLKSNEDISENKISREVIIPEIITVQELANRMAEKVADVVKSLMKNGIMANAAQSLEGDTAELIATDLGHKVKRITEDDLLKGIEDFKDNEKDLLPRPPVVTIMGHVDHGKTSILDALRSSNVVSGEAGGITQHIGAYQTKSNGKLITYIDTPGHEAFSKMRSRGAQTTDIVILVVAANDSVKPQTIEAISHAKSAKVPIIIAINKIDLPGADPDKVRNDLLNHELIVEKLQGDILDVEVSATKKTNLDKLQEAIILQADLLNLRSNPNRNARGVIIESKLEKGKGPVATVLVQKGSLKIGDIFVSGSEWGKVKALFDDKGEKVSTAPPSFPVEVLGFDSNPLAGDDFIVVENENTARKVSEYRKNKNIEKKNTVNKTKSNVQEMFAQITVGKKANLPVVIKADVQGSAEAIDNSINKLSTDEVTAQVLYKGVGAITESDVALANSNTGFIIGFNVRAIPQARDLAKRDGVDIKYYSIIYELIDDMKKFMGGLLSPDIKEKITGNLEIREVFSISKIGNIAGCYVKEGYIKRTSKVRILRDNVVIHDGTLGSLKRFKEEVKEVQQNYECGVMIQDYNDIKINDIIEAYEISKTARTL
ncbi:MAG: Translation initiation factor IF-2 [Alphaproteobacteria bacterium MarineAlpha5_Bin9]|nr:MAG: Translation initiation factor IF-2 [Alphaproteobacteria bacterium MarineAlpha5_Bin9]